MEDMGADSGTVSLPDRDFTFERSQYGDRRLNFTSAAVGGEEDEEGESDIGGWTPLPGGPWTARLMRPSRQPVARASHRNFAVPIDLDGSPLNPGGQIKFPIVAGAPADGIVCALPTRWSGTTTQLVFKLKLSKVGAPENAVTINQVLYRGAPEDDEISSSSESEGLNTRNGLGAQQASVPLTHVAQEALASVGESHQQSVSLSSDSDSDSDSSTGGEAGAAHTASRAPTGRATAAWARAMLDSSGGRSPEATEGWEAATEPNVEPAVAEGALGGQIGEAAHEPAQETADGAVVVEDGTAEAEEEAIAADVAVVEEKEEVAAEDAMEEVALVEDIASALARPPARLARAPPPRPGSTRTRKRKQVYGDNGELDDGPASKFRSAPVTSKPDVPLEMETSVPGFAMPGASVVAYGLHCGIRKKFKAEVVKLRKLFPRIVVRYTATADGDTSRLALPDPITAYVTASDVELGTLIDQ